MSIHKITLRASTDRHNAGSKSVSLYVAETRMSHNFSEEKFVDWGYGSDFTTALTMLQASLASTGQGAFYMTPAVEAELFHHAGRPMSHTANDGYLVMGIDEGAAGFKFYTYLEVTTPIFPGQPSTGSGNVATTPTPVDLLDLIP